jgi:uncharacterized protein (DUF885 family)
MGTEELANELLTVTFDAEPLSASMYGFPGYDDLLPDFSEAAQSDLARRLGTIAERAEQESRSGLGEVELQTLDFVRHLGRGMADAAPVPLIEFNVCDTFVAPVNHILTTLPKLPLQTEERRHGYLARLAALPRALATAADRHAGGSAAGRTAVARLVEAAIAQLDFLLGDPTVGGIVRTDQEEHQTFVGAVENALHAAVRPALSSYRDRLQAEVRPAARDDDHPGICYLPDGEGMYEVLVRLHTSMPHSPDELHALGREIVDQVRVEMIEVGSRLWGTSDLNAIFDHLTNDRTLRYASRQEMLEHARRTVGAAEAEALNWFGVVPDEACTVEPVPQAEETGMPAAYYMPGAIDGSRKGTYFLNTSKPEERFRHTADVLAFHEAVPGHHFQLTIALESQDLSTARRVLFDTACAEGWGLYSERLADEMGLYTDDLARMGLFAADSWRASRLVVDTGLHAMGWTREQAVDWLVTHTPMPRLEMEIEVDRYIAYPGQALAYMVGRREISRLRAEAAGTLGEHFDLRTFHDVVLRAGSLPLPALASTVERWVERAKG